MPIPTANEPLLIHLRHSYYSGSLPAFYNPADFPELQILSDNWKKIWTELQEYENKQGKMKGVSTYSPPGTSQGSPWSNLYLENFLWQYHSNRKHFPFTCSLLEKIPGLTFAAFAALEPGGSLEPHYGDTNAVIRCHLGLKIPAPHPVCGIRVAGEERGWQEGKFTLFSEAHRHHVWNHSNQRRYILGIDIIHPQWAHKKWSVCAKVLGAQSWVFFENRLPLLKKIPEPLARVCAGFLAAIWRIYLPFQRAFGKFFS